MITAAPVGRFPVPRHTFRPPLEPTQAILANALILLGEPPDMSARNVAFLRSRKDNVFYDTIVRFMLGCGYSVRLVTPFDFEAYLADGAAYLRHYYGPSWSGIEHMFGPDNVAKDQASLRVDYEAYHAYGDRFRIDTSSQGFTSIVDSLEAGSIVQTSITLLGDNLAHEALVYPESSTRCGLYFPDAEEHTFSIKEISSMRMRRFQSLWDPTSGIIVLSGESQPI